MANLLYRLGRLCARRTWLVLVTWLLLFVATAGGYLGFKGDLASSFSIPGTETARVSDELKTTMPNAAGATGTVVFQAEEGTFSAAQKQQIGEMLARVTKAPGVNAVTNPFTTQAQLDAQHTQLQQGTQQLAQGRQELATNQARLDAGQTQLDQAVAQAKQAGQYDMAKAELDRQQQELTAGRAQLVAGRATLEKQAAQVAAGQQLADHARGIRLVSADGRTAMSTVSFTEDRYTLTPEQKQGVTDLLAGAHIGGVQISWSSLFADGASNIMGSGETIGLLFAVVVLLVMMRSVLPGLTPVVSSLVGVAVGVVGSLAFSGPVQMTSITPVLGVMLGLAVGIDYSLFILHRHRKQVLAGMPVAESIGVANGTAGNAVVFAGSTVVIALLALFVSRIPFLGVMGAVGAACVAVAVVVAVTLTPALLGILGQRVLSRTLRGQIGHRDRGTGQVQPMRTRTALLGGATAVLALLVVAAPALSMRLGLPDDGSESTNSTEYRAYKAVEKAFGPGQNGPLVVVAGLPEALTKEDEVTTQARLADQLASVGDEAALAPIGVSPDRKSVVYQVIPTEGPSSESTQRLVTALRSHSPLPGGVTLGVAGMASGNIDVSAKLSDALPLYLAVVIGLSFVIMTVVFRSLLVPLIASLGYVLSLFAAFGGMTAVYQWGWLSGLSGVHDPGPILSFGPIIIMGVLFGLAMDYQLFIVSGMREAHVHGMSPRSAIIAGLRNGRSVVTAAALIMVSVFGGFMFSEMSMIRPLGFGLAFGVLFDAFAVRMIIVPALMHLLGDRAWWLPRWLDHLLPDVDVEGAALERNHPLVN